MIPVKAVFDIGKTNKKFLLFNEQYDIVYEEMEVLPESVDEDGFPCEDAVLLKEFLLKTLEKAEQDDRFQIKSLNFSGYGATIVGLDQDKKLATPIYNYLKPFDEKLRQGFEEKYGDILKETASPFLGNLNSGLQLYRIKYESKDFGKIGHILHFPQFLSYLVTGQVSNEYTSIGCHTMLWDFEQKSYHTWLRAEQLEHLFPPILPLSHTFNGVKPYPVGIGIHDSSAALIPYLKESEEPFILLSTGTWSICLNPFNTEPLTEVQLANDCLCFLSYEGATVKAARLFAGHFHEEAVKKIAEKYIASPDFFKGLAPQNQAVAPWDEQTIYQNAEAAYYSFMAHLLQLQIEAIDRVISPNVKTLYIDGGFTKNKIFVQGLANHYPQLQIKIKDNSQGSAMGAAMLMSGSEKLF